MSHTMTNTQQRHLKALTAAPLSGFSLPKDYIITTSESQLVYTPAIGFVGSDER